ncbi:hypothetical protein QE152_g19550 [Popillia japonica]|uniref:Uncharacterized protein n=1 Tax=Popillia japonica TaxID=7064 RepID=A0AAW1KQZ9_POPJA
MGSTESKEEKEVIITQAGNSRGTTNTSEFGGKYNSMEIIGVVLVCFLIALLHMETGRTFPKDEDNERALNKLYEKYDHIILVGDINIDALKTSINLDLMSDILDAYKMINLIDKPTRIFTNKFGDRSVSAIDCVATNLPVSCLSCCSVQPNLGDHLAQILDVGLGITAEDVDCCPQSIEMRSIGASNIKEFKYRLDNNDWCSLYTHSNVDDATEEFMSSVLWCFEVSCPVKQKKVLSTRAPNQEWINDDVKTSSNELRNLFWR